MSELANFSPWLLVVAPIAIVAAYIVFGVSGFGSTMISVPILAHFVPVAFVVPLMVLLDLTCSLIIGTKGREQVSKAEVRNILPFMFVGLVLGATVLIGVPDRWLRAALGVFAGCVGLYSVLNPTVSGTISRLWCIPAGIVGGAAGTIFGAGGPVYATYLAGRLHDKSELRATISTLISISAFTRAFVYLATGLLLNLALFVALLVLWPFVWIGLRIGMRIHVGLTQMQMRRAFGAVLVVMGASLVLRALLQ
jgi:uncharacterized membrane protein YfcA